MFLASVIAFSKDLKIPFTIENKIKMYNLLKFPIWLAQLGYSDTVPSLLSSPDTNVNTWKRSHFNTKWHFFMKLMTCF